MVLLDVLLFTLYRLLFFPVALFVLKTTAKMMPKFVPAKLQEMIKDRDHDRYVPLQSRPIWIHASSGEIEYAKSVIRSVKEYFPQIPVLVTYFSPSAKKLIQNFEGVDLAIALPWDDRQSVRKFLGHFNPRALLIARTDVWPEISYQTSEKHIPSLLFSATLSDNSSRKGIIAGSLSRWALNQLAAIHCVSESDEINFFRLKVKTPVEIMGDTRYDQVTYRLKHPRPIRTELKPVAKNVFVAGSTWPEDEEILLPALKDYLQSGGKVVIAPHEISEPRLQKIEEQLKSFGYSFVRYSQASQWQNENILLVDQIGCLQELYTWGKVAFVGGSFKDKVHSVMEPLCVGIPVIVGPHHTNNREALQFSKMLLQPNLFIVQPVQSPSEFATALKRFTETSFQAEIAAKIEQKKGATVHVMDWLQRQVF